MHLRKMGWVYDEIYEISAWNECAKSKQTFYSFERKRANIWEKLQKCVWYAEDVWTGDQLVWSW